MPRGIPKMIFEINLNVAGGFGMSSERVTWSVHRLWPVMTFLMKLGLKLGVDYGKILRPAGRAFGKAEISDSCGHSFFLVSVTPDRPPQRRRITPALHEVDDGVEKSVPKNVCKVRNT